MKYIIAAALYAAAAVNANEIETLEYKKSNKRKKSADKKKKSSTFDCDVEYWKQYKNLDTPAY